MMKEQQPIIEKPAKIPGKLKKPISKKTFEKKYLKFLEQPDDREWFSSKFELKNDRYCVLDNFNKKDVKRIKLLLAAIKNNRRGPFKLAPLVFTGIVVAGIVIFFAIFANPLLEKAMEIGLEAIFEAKSDVIDLRLSVFKFSIEIDSITVANRDRPMTNLFQLGKIRISLKPDAVLRGKIYIEEIRADTIRFGTARTVSGAIPLRPPKEKKEKVKSDAPPLIDLQNFDAMALLNREYDKLRTPKLYDEAINAYNTTVAKWQGQVDLALTRADELKTTAQPLLNINVNNLAGNINIRDPQSITGKINEINGIISNVNSMISSVQTAVSDATNMVTGIEDDINLARNLEQNARTAITGDIDHLKSYIDLSGGSAFAAIEPSIREILSDTGEMYFDYGLRALEVFEKLRADATAKPKTEKPKKEVKVKFRGRDVVYPVTSYPGFYLGRLETDFPVMDWILDFNLENISSSPDLVNHRPELSNRSKPPVNPDNPITLSIGVKQGDASKKRISAGGKADFRTNTKDRFGVEVEGSGFPISMGDAMAKVGVNGFNGNTAFSVNFTGHTDGGVSGGGDVTIREAQLIDPKGTIAQALDSAVREAEKINLGIQYNHRVNSADEFKLTTNIADLMMQAFKRIAQEYAQKAMDEIERVLRAKIDQYIDGRFVAKDELDVLFRLARGDKAAMDDLKNILNNKKTELENKVNEYTVMAKAVVDQAVQQVKEEVDQAVQQVKEEVDQAAQQVKEEAAKQGQQAIEDLRQGNQPNLQAPAVPNVNLPNTPSVPSLPKIPGRN